jgi:hypothetical protein
MRNKILHQRVFSVILAITLLLSQMAFTSPQSMANTLPQSSVVEIKNWRPYNWSLMYSIYSCRNVSSDCWVSLNFYERAWLMSTESILIDSSWKEPQLMFWNKYMSKMQVNFAYIEIQVEGEKAWDRIKYYSGTNKYWHQESIDLSAYSGKKIYIKFQTEPNVKAGIYGETGRTSRSRNPYNWQLFYLQDVTVGPKP